MPVRIRLARWGSAHNPLYGIVAANARAARDGKHLEKLGTYNPVASAGTKHVELDLARVKYWLSVGAQPTERVRWLLQKAGLVPVDPITMQNKGLVRLDDKDTWEKREVENWVQVNKAEKVRQEAVPLDGTVRSVSEATIALKRIIGL